MVQRLFPAAVLVLAILPAASCDDARAPAPVAGDFLSRCVALAGRTGHAVVDSGVIRIAASATPALEPDAWPRLPDAPRLEVGVRVGGPAHELGQVVDATRFPDGRVVVADGLARELRSFGPGGEPLGRVGGTGDGPGEYRAIGGLYRTRGDTLWVVDPRTLRLTVLGPELGLVDTRSYLLDALAIESITDAGLRMRSVPQPVGVFDDGALLSVTGLRRPQPSSGTHVRRDSAVLHRADLVTGATDSLQATVGVERYLHFFEGGITGGVMPLGHVASLVAADDRYYYGGGDRFEIEERGPDGSLRRLIRVCEPAQRVDAERWSRAIARAAEAVEPRFRVYEEPALRALPRPDSTPAYLELVAGGDRLWVRDFGAPDEPAVWKVFDRDGRWLFEVETPPGEDVLELGRDYVLTRRTDELGVHSVREYGIVR